MVTSNNITNIQREYFKLLRSHMVPEQNILAASGDSIPLAVKKCLSESSHGLVIPGTGVPWQTPLQKRLRELLLNVREFWFNHGHPFLRELQLQNRLYVWPIHSTAENERYIKRHSLYFDTVLKDCMLFLFNEEAINIVCKREHWILRYLDSYFTLLGLEKFVLLETEFPVCVVCPSPEILANSEGKSFSEQLDQASANESSDVERSMGLLLDFFAEVSDGEIAPNTFTELHDALHSLGSSNVLNLIQDKQLFRDCCFQTEESSLQHMSQIVGKDRVHSYELDPTRLHVSGLELAQGLFGVQERFHTIIRLEVSTMHTGSDPALSWPYWRLYLWMLKKGADELNRSLRVSEEEVAARILQSKRISWLEAIDLPSLVKIRENDGCEELRSVIRKQRSRIKRASIEDFSRIFSAVEDELERAFSEHSDRIQKERDSTRRSLVWGGTSFVITAALSLASLALPTLLPLAVGSALTTIAIGGKSVRDLINEHLAGKKRLRGLASRPIALLAEARENVRRG